MREGQRESNHCAAKAAHHRVPLSDRANEQCTHVRWQGWWWQGREQVRRLAPGAPAADNRSPLYAERTVILHNGFRFQVHNVRVLKRLAVLCTGTNHRHQTQTEDSTTPHMLDCVAHLFKHNSTTARQHTTRQYQHTHKAPPSYSTFATMDASVSCSLRMLCSFRSAMLSSSLSDMLLNGA